MSVARVPLRQILLTLSVGLWLLLASHQASADPAESERLIREGLALRREGRDAEALERFRLAHASDPTARAVAQMALAEQALGRFAEAEKHLNEALGRNDAWIAQRRSVLEQALHEISLRLGTLELRGAVRGAEVVVNGVRIGTTPLDPLRLAIGTHTLVVRSPGFAPLTRSTEIRPNAVTREEITLNPVSDPGTAKSGTGNRDSSSPPRTPSPALTTKTSSLPPQSWQRTAAWVALAQAGALLIGAIAAHVVREQHVATYNEDSCVRGSLSRKQRCGADLESANTAERLATTGYALAGVNLGVSLLLFATESTAPQYPNSSARRPAQRAAVLQWTAPLPF